MKKFLLIVFLSLFFSGCGNSFSPSETEKNNNIEENTIESSTSENTEKENSIIKNSTVKIIAFSRTENKHMMPRLLASGTIISDSGIVLTNEHVVTDEFDENFDGFAICLPKNIEKIPTCLYTATLVIKDKKHDFALLKIDPIDVLGENIPVFEFLSWEKTTKLAVKDSIIIEGFPSIGGKTLTNTQGQVSGFEERDGVMFLKIDAKIDSGNSGGTVKNEKGEFLGVPSFTKTGNETLGYIIPLSELQELLKNGVKKADTITINKSLQKITHDFLKKFYEAQEKRIYQSAFGHLFKFTLDDRWKIEFVDDTKLVMSTEVQGKDVMFTFSNNRGSYETPQEFLEILLEGIRKNKYLVKNYREEEKEFLGKKGTYISFEQGDKKVIIFIWKYKNAIARYQYLFPLDVKEDAEKLLKNLLSTAQEGGSEKKSEGYSKDHFLNDAPFVSLSSSGEVYVSPIDTSLEKDMIVAFDTPHSNKFSSSIKYSFLPKNYWSLEKPQVFEELKKSYSAKYNISNIYPHIVIDGLTGVGFEYSVVGRNEKEIQRNIDIYVFPEEKKSLWGALSPENKKKKVFLISISDEKETASESIEDFRNILLSLRFSNDSTPKEYNIPLFRPAFNDIEHHVNELEITSLYSHGIIESSVDSFFPEKKVTQGEFLEWAVKSFVFVERTRGETSIGEEIKNSSILEVAKKHYWVAKTFSSQKLISAGAASRILLNIYSVPSWNPPYQIKDNYAAFVSMRRYGTVYSSWDVNQKISRSEAIEVIYYFLKNVIEIEDL